MELTSFDFHALVKMLQKMSVHKTDFYSCTLTLLALFCNDLVAYEESYLCLSQQFYFFFFQVLMIHFQSVKLEGSDTPEIYLHPSSFVTASLCTSGNSQKCQKSF